MSGPISCDDVIRALAMPTADRDLDPEALADHLAACPACALEASRATDFDRFWNATRPLEPSTATWDGLWADICTRLDQAAEVAPVETPDCDLIPLAATASPAWRRWGIRAFGLAQAAALLVGFSLLLARPRHETAVGLGSVDIDPGQVVLIGAHGQVVRTAAVAPDSTSNALDDTFAMFNALEAMAD